MAAHADISQCQYECGYEHVSWKLTTVHSRSLIIMQTCLANAGMEVYMLLHFLSSLDSLQSLVLTLVIVAST